MKSKDYQKLKIGDKVKCNENGHKYEAIIEDIDFPYFYIDITRYNSYPSCAVTAKTKIYKTIIESKI